MLMTKIDEHGWGLVLSRYVAQWCYPLLEDVDRLYEQPEFMRVLRKDLCADLRMSSMYQPLLDLVHVHMLIIAPGRWWREFDAARNVSVSEDYPDCDVAQTVRLSYAMLRRLCALPIMSTKLPAVWRSFCDKAKGVTAYPEFLEV